MHIWKVEMRVKPDWARLYQKEEKEMKKKKKKGYLILNNFMLNVFYSFFEVGIKNIGYDYY